MAYGEKAQNHPAAATLGEGIGGLIARSRQREAQGKLQALIEEGLKNGSLEPAFEVDSATGSIKASFKRSKDTEGYTTDITNGIHSIEQGADPLKVYYEVAKKHPSRAAQLKSVFLTGRRTGGDNLFDEGANIPQNVPQAGPAAVPSTQPAAVPQPAQAAPAGKIKVRRISDGAIGYFPADQPLEAGLEKI